MLTVLIPYPLCDLIVLPQKGGAAGLSRKFQGAAGPYLSQKFIPLLPSPYFAVRYTDGQARSKPLSACRSVFRRQQSLHEVKAALPLTLSFIQSAVRFLIKLLIGVRQP